MNIVKIKKTVDILVKSMVPKVAKQAKRLFETSLRTVSVNIVAQILDLDKFEMTQLINACAPEQHETELKLC